MASIDSLKTRREITAGGKTYHYYSLRAAEDAGLAGAVIVILKPTALREQRLGKSKTGSNNPHAQKAYYFFIDWGPGTNFLLCQVSTIVRVSGPVQQANIISQRAQIPLKRWPPRVAHFAFREPSTQRSEFSDRSFIRWKAYTAA